MPAKRVEGKRVQTRLAPDVRRRQILSEATRLISIAGFNAVSLEDIAKACGIRGPSVLHYFPSMIELLTAVLAYRDEVNETDIPLLDDISSSSPESVASFLRAFVVRNLDRVQLIRLYAVLAGEAIDSQHPAHQYFIDRELRTYDRFAVLLRWKQDPDLAARELLAFWTGLERQWVMNPSVDFLAVWDNFADRFFLRDAD